MEQEPEIVSRAAFTVVGLRIRGNKESIPRDVPPMWGCLMQRADEIRGKVNPHEAFGVIGNFDRATGEHDYLAGFEVAESSMAPTGMSSWRVPAQTYAVFPCTLPTLMETFSYAYRTWFPRSGRAKADGPVFELYGEEFDPDNSGSRMYIYVPVK